MALSSSEKTSFLGKEAFSDVTVKFSGEEVRAHKVMLCNASEYFVKLCTGGFKEGSDHVIELIDDNPFAVHAMLRHIYRYPYEDGMSEADMHKYEDDEDSGSEEISSILEAELLRDATIYAVADKYAVMSLKDEAKASFCKRISPRSGRCDESAVIPVIKKVFESTPSSDKGLRGWVTWYCTNNAGTLLRYENFQTLLSSIPELAVNMVKEMAAHEIAVVVCSGCHKIFARSEIMGFDYEGEGGRCPYCLDYRHDWDDHVEDIPAFR